MAAAIAFIVSKLCLGYFSQLNQPLNRTGREHARAPLSNLSASVHSPGFLLPVGLERHVSATNIVP